MGRLLRSPGGKGKNLRTGLILLIALAYSFAAVPPSFSASSPAITNASASSPAFNSIGGQATIYYTLSGAGNGSMLAVIVDSVGRVDRLIEDGPRGSGRQSIVWDGKDGHGAPAPEGRYAAWLLYGIRNSSSLSYGHPFLLPTGIANATVNLTVDNTPPNTDLSLAGNRSTDGAYTTRARASLAATDSLSGVNYTEYSLDGTPWARYGGAIDVGDGRHMLAYRSVDRAGNTEGAKTDPVNVSLAEDPRTGEGDTAPVVTSTYPEDSSADVPVDTAISAWFDRPMDGSTIDQETFRLLDENGQRVNGYVDYGTVAEFIPEEQLAPMTRYKAILSGMADENGTHMGEDHVWYFTTVDASMAEDTQEWDDRGYDDNQSNDTADGSEEWANISDDNATKAIDQAADVPSTSVAGHTADSVDNATPALLTVNNMSLNLPRIIKDAGVESPPLPTLALGLLAVLALLGVAFLILKKNK